MLTFRTRKLANATLLLSQIPLLQNYRDPKVYRLYLRRLTNNAAWITSAMQGHRLIGCAIAVPVLAFAPVRKRTTELQQCSGVSPEMCIVRTAVHLNKGWYRQGIMTRIYEDSDAHAKAAGYSHDLSWGYDTPEIRSWTLCRAGAAELTVQDDQGAPFILRAL